VKKYLCFLFLISLSILFSFIQKTYPAVNQDNKVCIDKTVEAVINGRVYTFEVSDVKNEGHKGLMYRENLDEDSGMLFVFPTEDYLEFYMKNTYIPLDIAFIGKGFRIIDIQELKPLDETVVTSKKKALYALEVNRGFFNRVGLGLGDKIEFKMPGN